MPCVHLSREEACCRLGHQGAAYFPRKEQRWFTPAEVKKIVDEAEGQYKTLFALQFATGMRISETCGLHVEDVDLTEAIVHVRRGTFRLIESTPKTDAGYRDVDIDQATVQMLKEHIGDRVTGLLFHTKNGTPWWEITSTAKC